MTENLVHYGFVALENYGFAHLGEILKWEIEIQESKEFWECSAEKPSIEDELKQWKPFNELMLVAEPEEEILFVYEHHAPNSVKSNSTKVHFTY